MLSLMLAASLMQAASEAPNPYRVEAPARDVAGWRIDARTHVDRDRTPPEIENMECWARRRGLGVGLWRIGGISIDLGGGTSPDGELDIFDQRDIRSIAIDGVAVEARFLDAGYLPTQFVDVEYPGRDRSSTYDPDHFGVYSGALIMRRDATHPWVNVALIVDDLLQARTLRIGYREENTRGEEDVAFQDVPLDGLTQALDWCEQWMASDDARRLHPAALTPP